MFKSGAEQPGNEGPYFASYQKGHNQEHLVNENKQFGFDAIELCIGWHIHSYDPIEVTWVFLNLERSTWSNT